MFHHQRFVAHNGKIGPTGNTSACNGSYLRNAHRTHLGIVSKHSSKMFFIRKNFILHGQKNTRTIYNIYYWQMIFHGNFLHAQIFLSSNRKPSSCFHSLIIGHYNTLTTANITHSSNHATCRTTAIFCIHFISRKSTYFYKWFICINQIFNSFSSSKFIFFFLFCNGFISATFCNNF